MAAFGDPPLAPYHKDGNGAWLCNAAVSCNGDGTVMSWQHTIADVTDRDALRTLLGLPNIVVGDNMAVFSCATHQPV